MPKQAQLKKANDNLFLNIYKIGDIYITTNSENPADRFGGQWEQIQDKFLLCAGSTYSAGITGGSASHTHTTGNHTLTVNEIPSHMHYGLYDATNGQERYQSYGTGDTHTANVGGMGITRWNEHFRTGYSGGSGAHNHGDTGSSSNMPPYLAVYVWKRIA